MVSGGGGERLPVGDPLRGQRRLGKIAPITPLCTCLTRTLLLMRNGEIAGCPQRRSGNMRRRQVEKECDFLGAMFPLMLGRSSATSGMVFSQPSTTPEMVMLEVLL